MDEQQEAKTVPFPNPPAYLWQDFTSDNVRRIDEIRASQQSNAGEQQPHARLPHIPADLVNLNPPPEPTDGKWRLYGGQYDLRDNLPSLEEQGIERLSSTSHSNPKPIDKILELKRLSKSLLLNFLELVGVFASNPEAASVKVQDLHTLFINMHHILNEWRPHQTSEALISLMQDQLERTQKETNAIREVTENGRAVLKRLAGIQHPSASASSGNTDVGAGGGKDDLLVRFEEARRIEAWRAVEDLFP